jgi:hypothetical protein
VANEYINAFFNLAAKCNFPGCDELRTRYLKELRLHVKGCASCRRMGLVKKYKAIISNRLQRTD